MRLRTNLILIILTISVVLLFNGCLTLGPGPSSMVSLGAFTDPGETKEVRQAKPDGTGAGIFTVPGGKVLVITRVIIYPVSLSSGSLQLTFMQSTNSREDIVRQTWIVPASGPTELDFTPGYVISPRSTMKIKNDTGSDSSAHVSIYGYTTGNR